MSTRYTVSTEQLCRGSPMLAPCVVAVPCHNFKQVINRCVKSIFTQTYPSIEIIAIDDGSTDGTYDDLKHWASLFKTVRNARFDVVRTEENKGPAHSKWLAIQMAKTRNQNGVFVIVDGDDELATPDAIETIMNAYETTKCMFTYGRYEGRYSEQTAPIRPEHKDVRDMLTDPRGFPFGHPRTCSIRVLRHFNAEDFKIGDAFLQKGTDRPFIIKAIDLVGLKNVHLIHKTVYRYHFNPDQTTLNLPVELRCSHVQHANAIPKVQPCTLDIHVVMCVWKRRTLERIIAQLNEQTVASRVVLHVINNNAQDADFASYARGACASSKPQQLRVRYYESAHNLFGYARFLLVRRLLCEGADFMPYVMFIDDDQLFEPSFAESMYARAAPNTMTAWHGRSFKRGVAANVIDYWKDIMPKSQTLTEYDYGATCGCVIDTCFFRSPAVFRCPVRYRNIEDLWLSFVVVSLHGGKVFRYSEPTIKNCEKTYKDEFAQFLKLHDQKTELLRQMCSFGYVNGTKVDFERLQNKLMTFDDSLDLAAQITRIPIEFASHNSPDATVSDADVSHNVAQRTSSMEQPAVAEPTNASHASCPSPIHAEKPTLESTTSLPTTETPTCETTTPPSPHAMRSFGPCIVKKRKYVFETTKVVNKFYTRAAKTHR